jgi:hypothetical protein
LQERLGRIEGYSAAREREEKELSQLHRIHLLHDQHTPDSPGSTTSMHTAVTQLHELSEQSGVERLGQLFGTFNLRDRTNVSTTMDYEVGIKSLETRRQLLITKLLRIMNPRRTLAANGHVGEVVTVYIT